MQILYFSIYNSIIILFIAFISTTISHKHKLLIMIPIFVQVYAIGSFPSLYEIYKKTYYFSVKINQFSPHKYTDFINVIGKFGKVKSIQTKYQEIDLVESHSLANTISSYDYTLYLDRKPQFSIENVTVYHQSFAHAPIHLMKNTPEKVLILGGGDGLLAAELLRNSKIKEIKLIELDKKMVDLAKSEYQLLKVNARSLTNKRVKVIYDNALSYIRNLPSESVDAIYIDFPYPNNYELLKLYSYEFYREIFRIISKDGFAILDAPVISPDFPLVKENDFLQIFFNTTTKAGFKTFFAFGTSEPFIMLSKHKQNLKFNYLDLPNLIDKKVYTNLISFEKFTKDLSFNPKNINSVFKPGTFNDE